MEQKWFILDQKTSKVLGPYQGTEVEQKAEGLENPLVWGRGQSDWTTTEKWKRALKDIEETHRKTQSQSERLWKIREGEQEFKPMTHDQMMDYLKTKTDLSDIQIWTDGYTDWKDIYQIHKIMDELGVSRRQHPRVPIMGSLALENSTGVASTARILSISEGGLGMTDAPPVQIGEKFKFILKSPNLYAPLHATGEVVYVGNDGYAGIKFIGLHPESKSSIIEYVKKFTDARRS